MQIYTNYSTITKPRTKNKERTKNEKKGKSLNEIYARRYTHKVDTDALLI